MELIHRDEVNVSYIVRLLSGIRQAQLSNSEHDAEKGKAAVAEMLSTDLNLRSKRELIDEFIADYMPKVTSAELLTEEFSKYWHMKRQEEFGALCAKEGLRKEVVDDMVAEYHFNQKQPLREKIVSSLLVPPKILDRKPHSICSYYAIANVR